MKILVAGSSGLIGSALIAHLEGEGHETFRLVRPESAGSGLPWNPAEGALDPAVLEDVDAVVNLAGRSIGAHRWTPVEKQLLWDSRVAPTRLLAERLAVAPSRPRVLVNASAVGYYGDRGDQELTEAAESGTGFLADLCRAWEEATIPAADAGLRVVNIRSGIVLSTAGGALGRLLAPVGPSWLSPYRWGLGGPVGGGRQYWSWISLEDEVRAIAHVLGGDLSGPVNLTAPAPATNRQFVKALGRALHRPAVVPIPGFVVRLVLGSELARALVLDGQRALPERLTADGFEFRDTDLTTALQAALAR
ncbi:MAG: TIGR01777 family protein [Actinobacteria bacterium RBG_16_68_21]|nr:MAG: TIGR01777 family protein [Actinobacteria bacterium RBG_16_68_21]